MMRGVSLTWAPAPDQPPPGDKVVEGKWWSAQESAASASHPLVAITGQFQALRLNLHPGQNITLSIQDQPVVATVAASLFDG